MAFFRQATPKTLPKIDQRQTAVFETATFALG